MWYLESNIRLLSLRVHFCDYSNASPLLVDLQRMYIAIALLSSCIYFNTGTIMKILWAIKMTTYSRMK